METVETRDGRRIGCRRTGNGPPLVCHPGGPGFAGSALRDLAGLDEHFELVLIDPRGAGGSDASSDGRYHLEGYVDDLEDVVMALGRPDPLVLGHSHGGLVALLLGARRPDAVAGLVVVDTPSHIDDERLKVMGASDHEVDIGSGADESDTDDATDRRTASPPRTRVRRLRRLGPRVLLPVSDDLALGAWGSRDDPFAPALEEEDITYEPLSYFNDHEIDEFDLRPTLPAIDVETLVVCGRDDLVAPPHHCLVVATQLPRGQIAVIEGAGHVPYIENADAFHDAVLFHLEG